MPCRLVGERACRVGTMEEADAGRNWIEISTQSISWEKGREGGLGVMMTGMEPMAMQSVRWVIGLEGRVTRQKVAFPNT